jgi:hypothetical protein
MKVSFDTDELLLLVADLRGARQRLRDAQAQVADALGAEAVEYIVREHRSASQTTDTATRRRTGALARSYTHEVTLSADNVILDVGLIRPEEKVLEYALTQEFGATIEPREADWLTIPLPDALTEAGVPRGTARDFEDTFFHETDDGNLYLMQRRGDEVVALFKLVKSVTVPARPALEPARQRFEPELIERIAETSERILR